MVSRNFFHIRQSEPKSLHAGQLLKRQQKVRAEPNLKPAKHPILNSGDIAYAAGCLYGLVTHTLHIACVFLF